MLDKEGNDVLTSAPIDNFTMDYDEGSPTVTREAIKAEYEKQVAAEPKLRLREERTWKLEDCDWTVLPDSKLSSAKKTEWETYRQSLRDLPSTQSPTIETNNGTETLENVTWPTKPS
jgi:uncharacterized protein (DUF2344 family)